MFQDLFRGNFFNTAQISELENKLTDPNYPLEEFLKDDSAISCVKSMGKNTQKYFNPEKIKQLIKLITEEPETEDQLRGHKYPYVACEILKSNCPFILQRFVLNEQEYDEEYPDNNSEDEKEIDFDFCKNDVDKEFSKIEEKIHNLKNADNSKDGNEEKNIIEKDNDIDNNNNDNDNKKAENENSNNLNTNENKDINDGIKEDESKGKENNTEEKKEEPNNKNKENNEENNKENNKDEIKDNNDKQENNKEEKEEIKNENNENDNKEKIEESSENKEKEKEENKSSDGIEEKKEDKKEENDKEENKENIEGKENKVENKEEKENKDEKENKEEKENKGIEEPKEEKESNSNENKDIKEEKKDETQENSEKEKFEDVITNENKDAYNKEEPEEKNVIKEENNNNEKLEDKKEQEKEQKQEKNEEKDNIKTMEEKEENNKLNTNENEVEINLKKEEDSLSIEGEIEDIYAKKAKPKKKYENKPNNEYLDLLLNFVMSDKAEFNYVLSGYFANVMIILLDKYPSQVLKYLYTIRKDALRKIVFHSHQKAFAILSLKLLNLEILFIQDKKFEESFKDICTASIDFRNELIGEIIKSVSLEGIKDDKNEIKNEIDLEAKFGLVFEMIYENKKVIKYLVFNNDVYSHLFEILDTDLYNNDNNDTKTENNESNFDNKYNIYSLFIVLITKLLKDACSNYLLNYPNEFDLNSIKKSKKELTFSENMILTFGKILKNNFLPKKPTLILEKNSTIPYEGLGMLNIKIIELVKEMLNFMKQLPKQFDSILIRNKFCQRCIDYFFKYQWNNIYHIQFVEFFNLYLSEEEKHKELTEFFFQNKKFHEMLINYLNQDSLDEKDIDKIIPKQRLKFSFKSGRKINSGIYSHVIDLMYKIQAISGLDIFTEEEKSELKIKNYGEFEFSKDEKSNKFLRKINISNNIQNILKKSKLWNEITKNKVIPLVKEYETQLCKKEEKKGTDDNELDELEYLMPKRRSMDTSNYLFQQLISIIKKETSQKRFSLPLSRNDKNDNKPKNDKSSIREKLLNKGGFNNKKIFEDDDNDNGNDNNSKKEEIEDIKTENEDDKTKDSESNNKYNDSNYWEVKNTLPEKIKKEVDKKTNIIFNYNPTTYEFNNKEVSEEDELLSIAMGLEQTEKTEKNKKIMHIIPGKLKPINLKAKKNPVQSIFTTVASSNNENNEDDSLKNKDKENILENNEEKDKDNKQNENEENEEEEEAIIKNDEDKLKEENKDSDENIEKDNDKIYNDVNYWSTGNYLNEKEMEDCLKDL